jgi:hypothetical protein
LLFVLAWPTLLADIGRASASMREFALALKPVDALCLTLVGGTLAGGLVYDYGDRRMFPLLVPLSVYAARYLVRSEHRPRLFSMASLNRTGLVIGGAALAMLWISWWKDVSTNPWPNGSPMWWLNWAALVGAVGLGLAILFGAYYTVGRRNSGILLAALTLSYLFILAELSFASFAAGVLHAVLPLWLPAIIALGLGCAHLIIFLNSSNRALQSIWRWTAGGGYLLFSLGIIGHQLLLPTFSNRDASRAIGQIARGGEVILSGGLYDICIETSAKCVIWVADPASDVGVFNRDLSTIPGRKLWWTHEESHLPARDPAAPCTDDTIKAAPGALNQVAKFKVTRGADDWRMVLYEMDDARLPACTTRRVN